MRRAVSLTRVSSLAARPPRTPSPSDNGEYVVNRAAILASLLLLAVLVGAPACVYALWPSLVVGQQQPKDTGPLLVTVQQEVNHAPPPPAENSALEALREKQAWEAEARAVAHNDATRRRIRTRLSSRKQRDGQPETDEPAAATPLASPPSAHSAEAAASDGSPHTMRLIYQEAKMREDLRDSVPELRIDDDGAWTKKLFQQFAQRDAEKRKRDALPDASQLRELVAKRNDLAGLPFRWDEACKIDGKRLDCLAEVSQAITALNRASILGPRSFSHSEFAERSRTIMGTLNDAQQWASPEYVPALEQTLQTQDEMLAGAMINAFSHIEGRQASLAIARRAMYDPSPNVRTKAIKALRKREPAGYRDALTAGLRYPWGVVAMNAADALVELRAKQALPELIGMLDLSPPTAPFRDEQGRWVVRELVKVNHMRNCTLCHAPLTVNRRNRLERFTPSPGATIRGLVPTPGSPLPQAYYRALRGNFVRADVTYLRQDFSVMQYVENAKPWPDVQRFDFLVRTRVLTDEECAQLEAERASSEQPSQHREALLYSLRGLTGVDGGEDADRWRELVGLAR